MENDPNVNPVAEDKPILTSGKKQLITKLIDQKKKKQYNHHQFRPDRKLVKYYEDILKPHEYWDPKPTLRDDKEQKPGNIQGKRQVKDVTKEGIPLPKEDLYWCDINLNDEHQLEEVRFIPLSSISF